LLVAIIYFSIPKFESAIERDKEIRSKAMTENLHFQVMYNNGYYLDMYQKGTTDFQKITNENEFIILMNRKKKF
jgi:hypothetical protein